MEKIKSEKAWKLDHVGVVVNDLQAAIKFYEALGIGPFVPNPSEKAIGRRIRGKPVEGVKMKGAWAQMGPIQFELMQPVEGQSIQKEFLERRGEGINHVSFLVEDLDQGVAEFEAKGFKVISSGRFHPSGGFAYMDTDTIGGIIFALEQRIK